jgi:hypothetical protein
MVENLWFCVLWSFGGYLILHCFFFKLDTKPFHFLIPFFMHLKGMYALHLQSTGKVEPSPSGTKVIEDIKIYSISIFFAILSYCFF